MENKANNFKNSYYIRTFGCQMNENDSEKIAGLLEENGYLPTEEIENADLIILNTCSVRETAAQRAFGHIGKIKTLKKKNPELILAVCGCMMQQPENIEYINQKHPEVDLIFGTQNILDLPILLDEYKKNHKRQIRTVNENPLIEELPIHHKYDFKSYVSIMQGCNNFCSYCIVPYTRGRERSRKKEEIIKEVKELINSGVIEITLLGQNVNSYGKDLDDDSNFANLLEEIDNIEGIKRIRFMSSNPKDFTDDIIKAIKNSKHIMPSIHLALQSGSSKILKAMNRPYTKEEAIELVKKIKDEIPEISITTDIIVGFPGETEEDFLDTLDLIETCEFDNAFSFIYSIRKGTKAATMTNQIEKPVKQERISRLLDHIKNIALKKNQEYLGKTVEVLFERVSPKDKSRISGRDEHNKLIHVKGNEELIGQLRNVKITQVTPYSMLGEII